METLDSAVALRPLCPHSVHEHSNVNEKSESDETTLRKRPKVR
jgi:hypothetical protein